MKAIHQQLRFLANCQASIEDGTRIYHDGIIRVSTVRERGGIGFTLVAKRIPNAAKLIGHHFEGDEKFLKVEGLREALELRDEILTQCVQEKTHKTMRAHIEREVRKQKRAKLVRIPPKKEPKPKTENRRSSTLLF